MENKDTVVRVRCNEVEMGDVDILVDCFGTDMSKAIRSLIPAGEHSIAFRAYKNWARFTGQPGELMRRIFIDHLIQMMKSHPAFPLDLQIRIYCPNREDAYTGDRIFQIFRKWIGAMQGETNCRIEPVEIDGKRQWVALGWFDDDAKFERIKTAMQEMGEQQ